MSIYDNVAASSSRALTADDIVIGQTWYVRHIDTDGNVIRHYGPISALEAQTHAENIRRMGHKAEVLDTPQRIKRQLEQSIFEPDTLTVRPVTLGEKFSK